MVNTNDAAPVPGPQPAPVAPQPQPTTAPGPGLGGNDKAEGMRQTLARNWWMVALRGVFAIIFGLIAIFLPGPTLLSLAIIFAAYLLVDGVFGIVAAVRAARADQRWGWLAAEGALSIVMGIVSFLFPVGAVLAFVLVTAAWSLVSGGMLLAAAWRLAAGRWWMVLSGVISILFGLALAIAPLIGALVLTWWLGAYAIAFGIALLVLSFRLRGRREPPAAAA